MTKKEKGFSVFAAIVCGGHPAEHEGVYGKIENSDCACVYCVHKAELRAGVKTCTQVGRLRARICTLRFTYADFTMRASRVYMRMPIYM